MARVKFHELQLHMERWKIANPGWTQEEYMCEYYRKRAEDPKFRAREFVPSKAIAKRKY